MLWSSSAKYNLKQFEDALRSQGTDDPLPIPKKIHESLKYFLKIFFQKKRLLGWSVKGYN